MQPIDVDVNIDEALNVDIQLAAPISVPITLAPDVIINVDVDAVGPAGPMGIGIPVGGTTGQYLKKNSDGDYDTAWGTVSGTGTVSSVNATGANGVSVSGGPITTSGSLTIGLGAITPTSVISSGAVTGTNLSGTNTGDQNLSPYFNKSVDTSDAITQGSTNLFLTTAERTKLTNTTGTNTGDQTTVTGNAGSATVLQTARTIGTLTGDVTSAGSSFNGSANNTNATVLATVNSNVGTFGSASSVGVQTVNAKGLTTAASSVAIQIAESQVTNLVSDLAGKESALTFSTGLTRSTNTITVNTSQNISTLSNLTSNGLIKTSGGTGALSVATAGTDYQAPITLTTVGTSGASTLIGTTLNIPNYAGGGGSAGITRSISSISTNTNAGSTSLVDYVYIVSAGATLTLPTAIGNTNAYEVTNSGATNITVNTTSSQTINGNLSMLISPNSSRKFYSDTANWRVF